MAEVMTYICPFCGNEARVGKPCPGCVKKSGKTESGREEKKRSWEQDKSADGLGLPDEDFDYDDFVAREFGKKPHRKLGVKWYWWMLGVAILALLAAEAFLVW